MDTINHETYQLRLSNNLRRWLKRHSRRLDPLWLEAALILLPLDLDPIRPMLAPLYSSSPRGRPPIDPVCMFRSLLLMSLLGFSSIPKFAEHLRRKKRLAIMAGFPFGKTPACGTFYSFIDRLEDGPFIPSCSHKVNPSQSRKGSTLRNLKDEKADKEAHRKAILRECDSITHHLKDQLLASSSHLRPSDFQSRLEDIFIKTALKPSADRGLLGQLDSLVVSGDGSALETGAASTGRPTCSCRSLGIYKCKCPRLYSDPSADWGFDSYRETYYFGHTFYQHCVSTSGHDLPVHITIGPASESDFTLSLKSLDRIVGRKFESRMSKVLDFRLWT